MAALMVLVMGSVAGCGASSAESAVEQIENPVSPQNTYSMDEIEAPEQLPNILVDQTGFDIDSDKVAVFRAKELPKTFQIRDMETDEVVYTGEVVKPVLDEETGKYYGVGRFTDFTEPGRYYIWAERIGESFSFAIGEDVYREVFDKACQKYYTNRCGIAISQIGDGEPGHSACHTTEAKLQENTSVTMDVTGGWHMDERADRDTLLGSRVVENLLLSYELNADAFTDEVGIPESGNGIPDIIDEIRYEVDWLLKMQDAKTGGVYAAAVTNTSATTDVFSAPMEVTPVSMDSTIRFAAAMARFSYIYQQFDQQYATTALRAADRAYESFLINQGAAESTAAFNAAAQLYRATGSEKYRNVLKQFFENSEFLSLFDTDENIFIGSVTYLSTNQPVDNAQCEKLIKALMRKSEDIAQRATQSRYLVSSEIDGGNFAALLDDIRCLTITNHIIYNYEYTTIIENHVHYLMGMNPWCVNFVTANTERDYVDAESYSGIMNDPGYNALLIFMLSVLEK